MNKIRAVLAEDEGILLTELKNQLDSFELFEFVALCSNGVQAVEAIQNQQPDVVFLDIQMPGLNGFEVLKELKAEQMPLVIFITAYDKYAVNAFEVEAIDYLLKPINEQRLINCVSKIKNQIGVDKTSNYLSMLDSCKNANESRSEGQYSPILTIDSDTTLAVKNIEWIEAAGDYMCIHSLGKTHILRRTLSHLQSQLDPAQFVRIHRSTMINRAHIGAVKPLSKGDKEVKLLNGTPLRVSRNYAENLA